MDVALPDLSGVEATRQVLAHTPGVKVVALSVHADQQYVAGMLQAGASAYVLREEAAVELGDRAGQCAFGLPRRDSRSNRQQPPAGLGEVKPTSREAPMRSRCVAFVALLTGPLYAQGDVPTTLDAALEKATHELVDLRDETRKVFALDDTSYLAVYSDSPLHTWEGGQWSTITAEQSGGAETPRGPAGKLAQYIGFVVNGGGLRLTPEGEHQWDNNFRRLKKWNTNNHTYRISFAGYTPIPGGKYPIGYAHLILYQKTNSINCGAEVRLLDRISGVAEEMYDEIDKGLLIRSDPHIGRPADLELDSLRLRRENRRACRQPLACLPRASRGRWRPLRATRVRSADGVRATRPIGRRTGRRSACMSLSAPSRYWHCSWPTRAARRSSLRRSIRGAR